MDFDGSGRISTSGFLIFYLRPHRVVHGSDGPAGRVGSGRVGSGRVGSGRVGSGRVGSGRVGSGRVGSGRVTILPDFGGSGRVGSALRIF